MAAAELLAWLARHVRVPQPLLRSRLRHGEIGKRRREPSGSIPEMALRRRYHSCRCEFYRLRSGRARLQSLEQCIVTAR
jgi:hypothetical protein